MAKRTLMLKRVLKSIIETSLTAAPLVVVAFTVAMLVWAFVNHRSALSYCLLANTLAGRITVLDPQGKPLSQEAVNELLTKIEGARKELFDSNTITFLWSLLYIMGVSVAVYVYSRALESLRRVDKQTASFARKARGLVPLLESLKVSDVIAMLYGQVEQLVTLLLSRPDNVAPVLRDTFTAIEERLGVVKKSELGLEPWLYDRLILDVAQRADLALARLAEGIQEGPADPEVAQEMLKRSQRCLKLLQSREPVRRYATLLANVGDLAKGAR